MQVRAACLLATERVFGVTWEDISGRGRHPLVVAARRTLWSALRRNTTLSGPEIARLTGRPNHSTVFMGIGMFNRLARRDALWLWRLVEVELAAAALLRPVAEPHPLDEVKRPWERRLEDAQAERVYAESRLAARAASAGTVGVA